MDSTELRKGAPWLYSEVLILNTFPLFLWILETHTGKMR